MYIILIWKCGCPETVEIYPNLPNNRILTFPTDKEAWAHGKGIKIEALIAGIDICYKVVRI